jgi:AAA15 family ATPase/GTPase
MILKLINLKKDTKLKAFHFKELEFGRLNILIGKNGSGKSSIIKGIYGDSLKGSKFNLNAKHINAHFKSCAESLEVVCDNPTTLIPFFAREDNGKYRGFMDNDIFTDVACMFASEGQSNKISFGSFLENVGKAVRKDNDMHGCLLIDELESGLSPEVVREVMGGMATIIKGTKNMQIIMSSNNFETLNSLNKVKDLEFHVIDVSKGKRIKSPLTYDDFYKLYK